MTFLILSYFRVNTPYKKSLLLKWLSSRRTDQQIPQITGNIQIISTTLIGNESADNRINASITAVVSLIGIEIDIMEVEFTVKQNMGSGVAIVIIVHHSVSESHSSRSKLGINTRIHTRVISGIEAGRQWR